MYKTGDYVYVPNALEYSWEPFGTKIEEVQEHDGESTYYCQTPQRSYTFNAEVFYQQFPFKHKEVFPFTREGLASCKTYIHNYYYDGLCEGCEFEELGGLILRCRTCQNCKKYQKDGETLLVCSRRKLVVGNIAHFGSEMEACRYYVSNKMKFPDYEYILKNCDFNKNCIHHRYSCHKTCTYEFYLSKLIPIHGVEEETGRSVWMKIPRSQWIEADDTREFWPACIGYMKEAKRKSKSRVVWENCDRMVTLKPEVL